MRSTLRLLSAVIVFALAGCNQPPPPPAPPAATPPFHPILSTRQFMEWVIDPAADAVWNSVQTISTIKGTKEVVPKTDAEWAVARDGAATLAEAANLLMLDGRARNDKDWMARARRLVDAGEKALKAAEARDSAALFATGTDIFNACDGCHLNYATAPEPAPAAAAAAPAAAQK